MDEGREDGWREGGRAVRGQKLTASKRLLGYCHHTN